MTQATYTRGLFGISCNATPDYAPQFSIYAESGNGQDIAIVKGDNAERDAALFAAAPVMLAALERALENALYRYERAPIFQPKYGDSKADIASEIADLRQAIAAAVQS